MIRSNRTCKGTATDVVLLAIFLILAYVFIQRRGYMAQVDNVLQQAKTSSVSNLLVDQNANGSVLYSKLIDNRMKTLPDFRSKNCRAQGYTSGKPVSIILQFFDYQFYDLKTTIGSILLNTPLKLIKEMIIVDDGSTLQYIKEDAADYVKTLRMAKVYELPVQKGPAGARMFGANQATGDILVFVDGSVICSKGWLEPLISTVESSSNTIAVSHYDDIHDPVSYEYKPTSGNLVSTFSWALTLRMLGTQQNDDVTPLDSAVMRGNSFAVERKFFNGIGGYDDVMKDAAALALELSFRVHMCGGYIKVVPCSRIGVLALNQPMKVVNADSVKRITVLWMNDRADFIFKNTGVDGGDLTAVTTAVDKRKDVFRQLGLQCKSFDWFIQNVATNIYTPSKDARFYGLLKCKTGRCARVGQDKRIDLGACNAETYDLHPHEMLFELDTAGFIRVAGKCLAVQSSAYVVTEDCNHDETKHKWEHHAGGRLRNIWSNYCAMHVTDPDKSVPAGRQILMAQDCGTATVSDFITWEFIMP